MSKITVIAPKVKSFYTGNTVVPFITKPSAASMKIISFQFDYWSLFLEVKFCTVLALIYASQVMAWSQPGSKLLPDPMFTQIYDITSGRLQWFNGMGSFQISF